MRVRMYLTRACPYCVAAVALLERKGVEFERIAVDREPARRVEMTRLTGRSSVPQIFIGERHVGGYTELARLEARGELDRLLQPPH